MINSFTVSFFIHKELQLRICANVHMVKVIYWYIVVERVHYKYILTYHHEVVIAMRKNWENVNRYRYLTGDGDALRNATS